MKNQIKSLFVLFIIVMFGLMLRYQAVTETKIDTPIRADALKYVLYAYNLKKFDIYTLSHAGVQGHPEQLQADAVVTPGYPLFLSLFVNADGSLRHFQLIITQAVISTLTIILVYGLFSKLGAGWALLASFLTASSPHLVSMSTYVLTETLFCFLLIAFLALASHFARARTGLFLIAGIVLALATLTRPWTQAFILILLFFLPLSLYQKKITKPLLLLLGFVLVLSPWLIRNYLTLGRITDTSLSFASVHYGIYPDMMYNFQAESKGFAPSFDPWVHDTEITSQAVLDELFKRAANDPWTYCQWYLWGKTITVFSWDIIAGMGGVFVYPVIKTPYADKSLFEITYAIMWIIHPLLVLLSLSGAVLAWLPVAKHLPTAFLLTFRLLSLLIFYFILLHIIGAPYPRYSIPMRPVTYGMAAAVLACLLNYYKYVSRRHSNPRL